MKLVAPDRMNISITDSSGTVTTSNFYDVQLNNSNPITDIAIFMQDDYNGSSNQNVYWGLGGQGQQFTLTNEGTVSIGASNNSYTISSVIPDGLAANSSSTSSSNSLIKTGSGTDTLSADNTYSGTTTVSAGTLVVNGSLANSDVVVDKYAKLVINGSSSTIKSLTVNSYGTVTVNAGKALTVSGNYTNNGTVTLTSDATGNGSLIVDGTPSGYVTVQRYIPAYTGPNDGWHEVALPFTLDPGESSWDPSGTSNDLYSWDESTNTWDNYRVAAFTLSRGTGYLMAQSANTTNSGRALLSDSDMSFSNLSYTTSQGDGWHLLGNPFTSAVTWGDANWSLSNVAATAKIWSNSAGNYIDVNSGDTIPSTAGFFVQVTSGTNSLTIPAADRINAATLNNYKSTTATQEALKFKVTGDANSYYDENMLGFKSGATTGFDAAYDSHMLFSIAKTAPQIWTVSDGQNFSTNYLPPPSGTDSVQMDFQAGVNSTYHLSWSGINNISSNFQVMLVDKKTGNSVNMRDVSSYDFTASTSDNTGRFVLRINSTTGVQENIANSKVTVYAVGHNVYIEAKDNLVLKGEVTITNLAGQEVYRSTLNGSTQQVLNTQLDTGVYIVQLEMKDGTVTRKVVIR